MGFFSKILGAAENVLEVVNSDRNLLNGVQNLVEEYPWGVVFIDQPQFLRRFSSIPADDPRLYLGRHPLKSLTLCMPKVFLDPKLRQDVEIYGTPFILLVTFYGGMFGGAYDDVFKEMFPSEHWKIETFHSSTFQYGEMHNWFHKTMISDFRLPLDVFDSMRRTNALGDRESYFSGSLGGAGGSSNAFKECQFRNFTVQQRGSPRKARESDDLLTALAFQRSIVSRAEAGEASAQYTLSLMYSRGHGFGLLEGLIQEDPSLAVEWAKKAADQGETKAQQFLKEMDELTKKFAEMRSRR